MSLPVRDAAGAVPGRGEGGFSVAACAPSDCRTSVWESRHARNERPRADLTDNIPKKENEE